MYGASRLFFSDVCGASLQKVYHKLTFFKVLGFRCQTLKLLFTVLESSISSEFLMTVF